MPATPLDPMTGEALGLKWLASVQQMRAGQGTVVHSPVTRAREAVHLSQAQFAALMGTSVCTLQEWEQGRRNPSGAAKTLLAVAQRHPEVLRGHF